METDPPHPVKRFPGSLDGLSVRLLGRRSVLVLAGLLAAGLGGSAIAKGGMQGLLVVAAGFVLAGWTILSAVLRTRLPMDSAAVELPALLLLMADLVFRQRDAQSLAGNPLDPAGLFRVACVGLALLLGILALTSPIDHKTEGISTRPFRLYCAYVAVVFIGAPLSVNLPLTAYRGVELLIGVIVVAGAYRRARMQGAERILNLIYWYTAASAIAIWIAAAIVPGSAFTPVDSPFPVQLHGVFPVESANGVGTIGAILGLWSLARLISPRDRGAASANSLKFLMVLGFATLVFAQYRTGFIMVALGLLVLVIFRAKAAAFWLAVALALVAILWGGQILHWAEPIVQRGENPEVISRLSGRLDYWNNALPVWRESPFFGRGLLTASRFEVLAKMGSVYTSSIHGTWVEALVGTGLIGLGFLASAIVVALWRASREAISPNGAVLPLLLLVVPLVRSITGPTFEVAGAGSLLLLTITLLLRDPKRPAGRAVDTQVALEARL
jgi:O-antigen ligase